MADKLGLTNEIKEIKLGNSFGNGGNPSFHTFRYDFMPASVDGTKRATVDIGEGHQVTVTVPHIEGSGTAKTVFKGSKKPYQKECVLIIDHTTGEITLEKLSYNVQLKKTRAEGSSKIRPNAPSDVSGKKSPLPQKHPAPEKSHSAILGQTSPVRKCSPLPKSPLNGQPSPSSYSSMPMPSLMLPSSKPIAPAPCDASTPVIHIEKPREAPEIGVMSSSGSSSEDSSESGSSDSGSSDNETSELPDQRTTGVTNGTSSSPMKEMSSSQPSTNSLRSMPKFSQLSEDLKLSESDSDSDD